MYHSKTALSLGAPSIVEWEGDVSMKGRGTGWLVGKRSVSKWGPGYSFLCVREERVRKREACRFVAARNTSDRVRERDDIVSEIRA